MIQVHTEKPGHEIDIWGSHVFTRQTFIYQLLMKMRNGFSPIIGICGGQRDGKSFIGIWIAKIIYDIQKKAFDPTTITFYEPEKAIRKLGSTERGVIFIDEGGDIMDYQEWYKQAHRALRSMINTQAYRNNLYIFVSPFLPQIDKSLRIHCDFIIKVTERGRFKVWKYHKRYDAEKIDRATDRIFLDEVSIKMNTVPKEIWSKYLAFSISEKERIRISRLSQEIRDGKYENEIERMRAKDEFEKRRMATNNA